MNFELTEEQANAILEMRLRRLSGLEREKLENELKELKELITSLEFILANDDKKYELNLSESNF